MSGVAVRRARAADVHQIAALINAYAGEGLMLPRTPDEVALAIDDYVVIADAHGRLLACGALREYSPSVAEISSIAVVPDAQGRGLGAVVVREVEVLARQRGFQDAFLITVGPRFFARLGYTVVDRALYPEKICPHDVSLAHCDECAKVCMWRDLRDVAVAA
jgi:amino-acid N-acetyltransferase